MELGPNSEVVRYVLTAYSLPLLNDRRMAGESNFDKSMKVLLYQQ